MNQPRTFINLEETIGKQVGRRKPPVDPLRVASDLNKLAAGLMNATGHKLPRRGVFRFQTHEGADQWMTTMGPKTKGWSPALQRRKTL